MCFSLQPGDKIGCGIKFEAVAKNPGIPQWLQASLVPVYFTKNGKEVGKI